MSILRNLIALTAITIFSSCAKENIDPLLQDSTRYENVYTESKSSFSLPDEYGKNTYFLIGYGYDAKENIIHIKNGIRALIVNPENLEKAKERTSVSNLDQRIEVIKEKITKQEVFTLLSLNAAFKQPWHTSSTSIKLDEILPDKENYLLKTGVRRKLYTIDKISGDDLGTDFLSDIDANTPAEIVQKYGTHIIQSCTKGGYAFHIRYITDKQTIQDVVNQTWQAYTFISGGDISKMASTFEYAPFNWINSVNDNNQQFVDFGDKALKPIYDLLADEEKKTALKNYITAYLEY